MNENSLRTFVGRGLPEACLSDLTLDRLHFEELSGEAAAVAQQHLDGCERCRQRAQTLALASEQLKNELPDLNGLLRNGPTRREGAPPPDVASLDSARRRRGRWWAPTLAVLSAAAAVALFLGRPEVPDGEIRLKGVSGELDVFVKRDGKVFRWQAEPLQPGDQLRYSFRAPEPLNVMVLSREATGAVNQYFPAEPHSFAVSLGVTLSKSATELDATVGTETLWAVFCREPFPADGLLEQLQNSGEVAPAEGCATQRLEFVKAAP